MHPRITQLVIGLFIGIFALQNPVLINGDQTTLKRLCGAVPVAYIPACNNCMGDHPGSDTATDAGVVQIAMNCAENTTNILYYDINRYLGYISDNTLRDVLKFCSDQLSEIMPLSYRVSDKLKSRDFYGAKGIISSVMLPKVDSCTQVAAVKGITMPEPVVYGLANYDRDWGQIVVPMLNVLQSR